MDDEQQAWWTRPATPGGASRGGAMRPVPGRAGPPEDPIELLVDDAGQGSRPIANPRVPGVPLAPTAPPRPDGDPPTRPVEYLTVRLDPEPRPPRSGDTMDVPASALPRLRQARPERPEGSGFRRGPAAAVTIVIAVGVLLVVVAVAVIASKVATGDPGPSGSASTVVASPANRFPGTPPDGLTPVSAGRAATLLRQAGETDPGTVRQAFTWTDDKGQNLLVTATRRTSSGTTLRVVHVAGPASAPRTLRTMIDPSLPLNCANGGRASFTAGSIFVRDLDDDGVAEATIGWTSRCSGGRTEAKLALVSGSSKYIIRGRGTVGERGSGSADPDPARGSWPPGFFKPVAALYRSLYF